MVLVLQREEEYNNFPHPSHTSSPNSIKKVPSLQ
jgi:hypothetical protein